LGIIGTPIDYYFEWVLQRNLIAPVFALGYIPLFIVMGLSADISFMKLHPEEKPLGASLVSSFIFTATVLLAFVFATFFFYPVSHGGAPTLDAPWINMGIFLIPYSLATGTLGGYLGFCIAKDIDARG